MIRTATATSITAPDRSRRAASGSRARKALDIAQDAAGERAMTSRFIDEALVARKPALAILWMGEPDATQHTRPLGSPDHLAVLRQADANAARVIEAVDRLRDAGDDVLLIACSDHGHQTVSRVLDVEAELVAAGLKESREFGRRGDAHQRYIYARLRASRQRGEDRGDRRFPGQPRLGRSRGAGGRAGNRRPGAEAWARVRDLAQVRR